MSIFTLDVGGKIYKIEAPDEASARDAALNHYEQNVEQQSSAPTEPAAPQQAEQAPAQAASPEAQAFYQEQVQGALVPIEFTREGTTPVLQEAPSKDFVADWLSLGTGQAPTEADVTSVQNAIQRAGGGTSTKQWFDTMVASGKISPEMVVDPAQAPAFASAWEQYKAAMAPSVPGAFARGAVRGIGPTVGGLIGGAAGGLVGTPGGPAAIGSALAGGAAGAKAGGFLQEAMFPPSAEDIAQAQFDISKPSTRIAGAAGEVAPSFVGSVPSASRMAAIAGRGGQVQISPLVEKIPLASKIASIAGRGAPAEVAAARALAAKEGAIGAATTLATEAIFNGRMPSLEEVASASVLSAVSRPTAVSTALMNRAARESKASAEAASRTMQEFAKRGGQSPFDVAARLDVEMPELTQGGVTPMVGEVSQNAGLLGLQTALEDSKQGDILRAIRLSNRRNIAAGVARTLEEIPQGDIRNAQRYFEEQNEALLTKAAKARDSLIETGEREAAQIIQNAIDKIEQAKAGVKAGVDAAEKNFERSMNALREAQRDISTRPTLSSDEASELVKGVLEKKEEASADSLTKEYNKAIPKEKTPVSSSNTRNAIVKTMAFFGSSGGALQDIKNLVKYKELRATKKKGTIDVNDLLADRRNLSALLRIEENPAKRRAYSDIIDGIDADLDAAAVLLPGLKQANAMRARHADLYENNAARGVLRKNKQLQQYESKTIGEYMGQKESMQQLRESVDNDPSVIDAVSQWILNKFITDIGTRPTEASIADWKNREDSIRMLNQFPEARRLIGDRESAIYKAESQQKQSKEAVETAKQKKVSTEGEKIAREKAAQVKSEAATKAKEAFLSRREEIQNRASSQAIGKDAQNAIQGIFEAKDRIGAAQEIMARAEGGGRYAVAGIRNALGQYLNKKLRLEGSIVGDVNDPRSPLTLEEFEASFAKLNRMLAEGEPERGIIEVILGKDSKQLRALDFLRRQYEVIERKRQQSKGESATSLKTSLRGDTEETMANNTLSLLQRMARGFIPSDIRRKGAGGAISALADFIQARWSGDVSGKARAMLIDAMTGRDPNLAPALLRGVTPETAPEIKNFIKLYAQPAATGVEEKYQEEKKK